MNLKNRGMKWSIPTLLVCLVFLGACMKLDDKNPLDGLGSPYLRLDVLTTISNVIGFNVGVTAMDASPHTQTAFIIHRDAISNGDLNKTVTVDFALDPTYMATYNQASQHVYDTARVNDSIRVYNADVYLFMHFINAAGHTVAITANNYDSLAAAAPNYFAKYGVGFDPTFADWQVDVDAISKDDASSSAADYAEATAPPQYTILPPNVYSFKADGLSGSTLTFAAGETTKELQITIDPTTLSFTTAYAIPLTIINPTGGYKVSGDNSAGAVGQAAVELLNQIIVKNQWDGVYSYEGFIGRWDGAGANDPTLGGPIAKGVTMDIVTAGATTDTFSALWATGASGIGGIGSAQQITVNPDNSIVLTPIGANPANWGPIAGKDNKYDPATQTFTINYRWGGTDPGSTSGFTREMMLTMKYKGAR